MPDVGLAHVALFVSDLEASRASFGQEVGLTVGSARAGEVR